MCDEMIIVTKAIATSMTSGLLSTFDIMKLGKIVSLSDGIYGVDSKWCKDGKCHNYRFRIKVLDVGAYIW